MATTISRTWYDTLVDDSGSGTDGSVWDKADVDSLLDAVDAIFAADVTLGGALTATRVEAASGTIASLDPAFVGSQTWNSSGVTFKGITLSIIDTASAAASLLLDLQVGGSSKFKVQKDGAVTSAAGLTIAGALTGATTGAFSGALTVTDATSGVIASSATPRLTLNETDGAADNKRWDIIANVEVLSFRAVNDAITDAHSFLDVQRTGITVDSLTFPEGGLVVGSPTGGNKGTGIINAVGVYDDNTLLTDWVFDLHYAGTTEHRVPEGGRLYGFDETMRVAQIERRLPWMPTRTTFERERSLGGMVSRLWFGQEQQQIYLAQHDARIAALEAKLGAA